MHHRGTIRAARLALACFAVLTCLPAAAAHADAYTGEGLVQLKSSTSSGSQLGGMTTMSSPANGTFYCSVPFAAIQAKPSGFVVGTARRTPSFAAS